ncbi:MAG: hypothetical protein NTW35_00875 [Candidatus Nomurabacteria bacterium]|nr:hypothetical protein [Candidatus Nomurabacteria bacterium]
MPQNYLTISMSDMATMIYYVSDGNVVVAHNHDVGFKQLEADGLGIIAASKLLDGVMYTLEFISLHDRIPTEFYLATNRYTTWLAGVLQGASYAQFYTENKPVRVTLDTTKAPSINYARHKKTVFSFKV